MGKCECSCGQPTNIIKRTDKRFKGQIKGEYSRFIRGHNTRINNPMNNPDSIEKIKQKTIERCKDREYSNKHKKACKDYYKTHQHHIKGKPKSIIQKLKMSIARTKWYKNNPEKAILQEKKRMQTHKNNPEIQINITKKSSAFQQGIELKDWKRFISKEPYSQNWNKRFKREIRKRDNQICMLCGIHREKLNEAFIVHHINYNKKMSIPQNCISLCRKCHIKTNFDREIWIKFFQSLSAKRYGYQYSEKREIILELDKEENQNHNRI